MEDGKIAGRIALSMLMNASSVGTIVDHLGFSVLNEHVWVIKHQHDVKSANHVTGADLVVFLLRVLSKK